MSNSLPIFYPTIFARFPEVVAAHSLRDTRQPSNFTMTAGGTTPEIAAANLADFAEMNGFPASRLAVMKQEHGEAIYELAPDYDQRRRPTADAIITDRSGWLVGVRVADCITVLLYDPTHHAVAAVHSGWRGSAKNITGATIKALSERYDSRPAELWAFVSPAPNRHDYEVGLEVAQQFDAKYSSPRNESKAWFDNKLVVRDQLLAAGVPASHIEVDPRSTITDERFHSYRREGDASGRMVVAIGLKAA